MVAKPPEGLIVLVVDDEPITRRTLREELEPHGFFVIEAGDGDEAWNVFQKEFPDLVVTDLRMPRCDGVELVRRIRTDAKSWIPIIVLTSQTDLQIIKMAVQATREAATEVLHLRHDLDRLGEIACRLSTQSVAALRQQKKARDKRVIITLLPECHGNISKLSRLAEIPRSTVYGLLKEMNLLGEVDG